MVSVSWEPVRLSGIHITILAKRPYLPRTGPWIEDVVIVRGTHVGGPHVAKDPYPEIGIFQWEDS